MCILFTGSLNKVFAFDKVGRCSLNLLIQLQIFYFRVVPSFVFLALLKPCMK